VAEGGMASVESATDFGKRDENTAHCMCQEIAFENRHFACYNDIKKII